MAVEDKVKEHKVLRYANWALFIVLAVVVICGAGVFILKNQERVNAELLEGLGKVKTAQERIMESGGSNTNPQKEVAGLDEQMNLLLEEDFSVDLLGDAQLSL